MTMNVLDFFASYTAPITGVSFTMQDASGICRTVVNSETERDRLIADGWKVISEVRK